MTKFDGRRTEPAPRRISWRMQFWVAGALCVVGVAAAFWIMRWEDWPLAGSLAACGAALVALGMVLNLPAFMFSGLDRYNPGLHQAAMHHMASQETPNDRGLRQALNIIFAMAGLPLLLVAFLLARFG